MVLSRLPGPVMKMGRFKESEEWDADIFDGDDIYMDTSLPTMMKLAKQALSLRPSLKEMTIL